MSQKQRDLFQRIHQNAGSDQGSITPMHEDSQDERQSEGGQPMNNFGWYSSDEEPGDGRNRSYGVSLNIFNFF